MKLGQMIIFLSIVLSLHTIVNYYIYARGIQALSLVPQYKLLFRIGFSVFFLSFILARILDATNLYSISHVFNIVGTWWMAAMLYFVLILAGFDILRLLNHVFHIFPSFITDNYEKVKLISFFSSIGIVLIILISGRINSISPIFNEMNLLINKSANETKSLNLVLASDLHIGTLIPENRAARLVEMINSKNPDIVILAGDLLDEVLNPVIERDIASSLRNIKSKFGVYAVLGNHEYIGGVDKAIPYIKSLGINLLRDSVILINNSFYLIGRDDRESARFNGTKRKDLAELIKSTNQDLPRILIDHQPMKLEDAVNSNIDLQLSGHTHNAQLFPLNFILKYIYTIPVGYGKIQNSQFYISSGYGTWGPPIRLGSRPEVAVLKIDFKK
jgi:predicted MPP superfamily phosphohydrolase